MEKYAESKLFKHSKNGHDDDFKSFVNPLMPSTTTDENERNFIFTQESRFKFQWDIFITILLLTVCTVVPVHIVFKYEGQMWCIVFFLIDFGFLIDIFMSFFTSIPETENEEEIIDKKKIAVVYL